MGNTGRRYDDEFKIEAVLMASESDRPYAEIARELGISSSTLRRWRRELGELESEPRTQSHGASAPGVPREPEPESPGEEGSGAEDWATEDPQPGDPAPGDSEPETSAAKDPATEDPEPEDPDPEDSGSEESGLEEDGPRSSLEERGRLPLSVAGLTITSRPAPGRRGDSARTRQGDQIGYPLAERSAVDRNGYPRMGPASNGNGYPLPDSGADPSSGSAQAIELSEVIGMLKRRSWVVLLATLVCLSGAVVLAMREVPTYRATAVVRVGATEREAVTQGFEAQVSEAERYVNPLLSRTELLQSRSLIGDVVDTLGFRLQPDYRTIEPGLITSFTVAPDAVTDTLWLEFDTAGFTARMGGEEDRALYGEPARVNGVELVLAAAPEGAEEAMWRVVSRQAAVDRLLADLRVSPRPETNIVDVSFSHPDPLRAQLVANTLVTGYQRFEAQFAQDRSRRRRIFLEEQLAQTDSALARARSDLRAFQTSARTYDARQELSSQQQNRMMLDIRRGELEAELETYRRLLDRLASTEGGERWEVLRTLVSTPGIAENAAVIRAHEQLLQQRSVLDSLTTGDVSVALTHPDVQRQRQLIAMSENDLTGAIRSHVASLEARIDALYGLALQNAEALSALPGQLAEEARLEQIIQTHQDVSDHVRAELQRARVAEAATVGQADIIDLAALPYRPEPGTRAVKAGVGLLFGLILGGGIAVLLERRGGRFVKTRKEIEHSFRLPVLGVIPRATDPDLGELERRLSANGKSVAVQENDNGRRNRAREDDGRAMEAYRLLRTNFMYAGWTSGMRNIVVTSTAPREGKTLTATSLALAIAEEGVRVLLVDADLWRGRIHEILDAEESPGLSDLLSGEACREDAIRRIGGGGLDFLPRGTRPSDPSSVAKGTALREVLEQLGSGYDVLVVDGPPVLAAGSAPVLSAIADGVIFLVRAGQTNREALGEALRELDTVGACILGVVLNDPDEVSSRMERRYAYYEYATT